MRSLATSDSPDLPSSELKSPLGMSTRRYLSPPSGGLKVQRNMFAIRLATDVRGSSTTPLLRCSSSGMRCGHSSGSASASDTMCGSVDSKKVASLKSSP